jgi:putative nucleotidyltransferase with HDIG domain
MHERRVQIYVGVMWLLAIAGIAWTDWTTVAQLDGGGLLGLGGLIAVGVLSESLAIKVDVGRSGGSASITFLPLLAGVQLFGPAAGVVLVGTTQLFGEFIVRRKGLLKGSFNLSQAVFATTVAGWAFSFLGGMPLEGAGGTQAIPLSGQLWPFVTFGLLFLALNHAAVSLAITLSQGLPFRRVWERAVSLSGASLNDLLISPIALAVAFLYVQFGVVGIIVVLLPMLFIRYSYLTTSRLRVANRDLLSALVKAIETRDPYTSGHSLRVSRLARRVGEELGLAGSVIERIETAALLHDIGKIEAVYTDILRKPDSLTDDERSVIQSHVTKGEELLRDLSSVPEDVVRAVRHHHEREDGHGYPDRLLGDEIPIGAKIIVACDAVDAMLSDRPYRKALAPAAVKEQLRLHAGQQFDHRVARALLSSAVIDDYAAIMESSNGSNPIDHARTSAMSAPEAGGSRRGNRAEWPRRRRASPVSPDVVA